MMRNKKLTTVDGSEPLVFQIISWNATDEDYGDDSGDDEDERNYDESKYLVKVYGCTEAGHSVSLNILNFTPFFYVRVDHKYGARFTQAIHEHIVTKLPWNLKNSLVSVKMLQRKDFWGFTNFKDFNYMRVTFKNLKGFRAGIRMFNYDIKIAGIHTSPTRYKLYESNIEPFLRLMHIRELQPSGWCVIPQGKYSRNSGVLPVNCQIDVECDWKDISPYESESIAPFVIASFDIECTSSHGDFPVAKKDYRKVANDIVNLFFEQKEMEPEALQTLVQEELVALFTDAGGKHLGRAYPKEKPNIDTIRKTVTRHADDIMNILKGRVVYKGAPAAVDEGGEKKVKREYITNTMVIKLNNIFPVLEGDMIIQIGTTVHCYGEKQCSYKNIVTLGTCDPIEGVEVISCASEEDLLLKWRDMIVALDPDVMIGYNIFGFDMAYMHDRADERGIAKLFCKMGRIRDKSCEFKEKMLSSSALGDNILKFVDVDGRVLIDIMKVVQRDHKLDSFKLDNVAHHFIGLNKHDVHPNDIFRLQKGSAADRKIVAEYCVQDCELCNLLTMKLEILANNIGMSNVCSVPLSYIFMRGQGIKIFSLVAKECRNEDFLIPSLQRPYGEVLSTDDDGYEGAIVLEPKTGIYIEDPICVLDYASLYPSSMISENLSHDCIVTDPKYDNLPGVEYLDISYDVYEGAGDKKQKVGEKVCRFVQNEKGIIPRTLQKLLRKRKETRKKIEWQTVTCADGAVHKGLLKVGGDGVHVVTLGDGSKVEVAADNVLSIQDTYDDFQKAVLDGLQLAYKVTANSLYGQIGARTSQIYLKDIAACTTATGRKMIMLAKDYIEKNNDAEIIYGDTDSLFVKFNVKDEQGNRVIGKEAIPQVRELGIQNSKAISKILKPPHDLEWEKIFYPFILLSKKRYVANKYEYDDHKCKQNSMGIVLKRRDNANIVKKIYGGIIDTILNEQNVQKSIEFLLSSLHNLVQGNYPIEDLVITKSLRADYKDPDKIAHKMLADRIKERDPGNAPNVNDRIPFVYVKTEEKPKGQKTLQGERIETPDYIRAKDLKPDYEFYITNQVMNPVLQVYALALDQLPGYDKNDVYWKEMYDKVLTTKENDIKKTNTRIDDLREAEVKRLLFDPILHILRPPKPRAAPKAKAKPKASPDEEGLQLIMKPVRKGRVAKSAKPESGDLLSPIVKPVRKGRIAKPAPADSTQEPTPTPKKRGRKINALALTLELEPVQ